MRLKRKTLRRRRVSLRCAMVDASSLAPFCDEPCRALLVCCSDHRFARAHRALAEEELAAEGGTAWLAIPGGPASLASREAPNAAGAREQARFILRALQPASVLLVAHDRCAFYEQVCGVPLERLEAAQERDLRAAARWVSAEAPGATLLLRRLEVAGERVQARPIPIEG